MEFEIKKGLYTALITPFENGVIHRESLIQLVENQIKDGVNGFVILGTTGESSTLSLDEKKQIFHLVREVAQDRVPLIVGTGSNSTSCTINFSRRALDWGADGVLVVTPYYNKPSQKGLLAHFSEVAKSVQGPIILYDVPGRTGVTLDMETIKELAKNPYVVGVKDATGNLSRVEPFTGLAEKNNGFLVLSGDDETLVPFLRKGGHGAISVLSHIFPREIKSWMADPNGKETDEEFKMAQGLIKSLFVESNPVPLKMAMYLMGIIPTPEVRLPLVELDQKYVSDLRKELNQWKRL